MNKPQFDQVTYGYWDAPMPGFVSYEIRATADSVRLKVSAFEGSGDTRLPFDRQSFESLLEAFERHAIGNCERERQDDGCSGGTTDSIECRLNGKIIFSGKVYHCGGVDFGDLCGDIDAFAEELKKLLPGIERELKKYES